METEEKTLHQLFDVSILIKSALAFLETIGGISVFIISSNFIFKFVNIISFGELTETPIDSLSQYLLNLTHSFSGGTKEFVALYLLFHGIINLIIITGLFKKKIFAYHTSFIVFVIFAFYEIYRYLHHPSIFLIILVIFDSITVWLTWKEYERLKKQNIF
jgi:uncharacterized membrane protein